MKTWETICNIEKNNKLHIIFSRKMILRSSMMPLLCSFRSSIMNFEFSRIAMLLLLLLFLTFSVLVANPKKLLYTVANPARGLLNREKRTKEKVWQHTPPPPPPTLLVRRKYIKSRDASTGATQVVGLASVQGYLRLVD